MKKNKTTTYILLVVVIALWVVVFYRLYKSFFSEGTVINTEVKSEKRKIKNTTNDKFVLLANYSDPFFGKSFSGTVREGNSVSTVNVNQKTVAKPKVEKQPEVKVDWSFISYIGLIKNQGTNKQVALVNIHGREYMVSEGDKIGDVSFIKNFKDSVKVSYQGKTAYLRKM